MTPVTDPSVLQQLEPGGAPAGLTPVDPTTAKFLNGLGEAQTPDWATQIRSLLGNPQAQAEVTAANTAALRDSPVGGLVRGLRDLPDQGAAMLTRGLQAAAPAGSGFEKWAEGQAQNVADINRAAEKDYAENWRGGAPPGFDASRLAGNIAATAPIAYAMPGAAAASLPARMLSGAATGAASGALQPVGDGQDFWHQTLTNAAQGGAFGAAAPPVMGALSRLIRPNAVDRVAPLMNAGVMPTPGQVLGGPAGRLEEAATSIPLLGDFVKSGRANAVQQFNRAAIDQTLAPIGESLARDTPLGREAISEAAGKIGTYYDKLVPQLSVQADPQFSTELSQLLSMSKFMPQDRAKQFGNIVADQVLGRMAPGGGMTGETFKEVESTLGRLGSNYGNSVVADERQLGGGIRELQNVLRDLLTRSNPDRAGELAAANNAYANLLRVQGAAGRLGSEEGVFSPAQLLSSVRQLDPTLRKSAFARGNALMQDFAETGKSVLGSKVPDSGTPFRSLATIMGGAALGHGISPEAAMGAAGMGAGAAALYSPAGKWILAHMLASRPDFATPLAGGVRSLAPTVSSAAPWAFGALAP